MWGVFFQYTMHPPALHITVMSNTSRPYSAMSAEQAEEALSRMTVPELFAKFSSMVEPDFMPRIPVFIKEGYDIIPFQTRAPGTVPAKLQISADYKDLGGVHGKVGHTQAHQLLKGCLLDADVFKAKASC